VNTTAVDVRGIITITIVMQLISFISPAL